MEAVDQSGVLRSHALGFSAMAFNKQCFILIRPVNLQSTGLIQQNYATKNLHVKAKSSTWGPHAGFIPFQQHYSKLFRQSFASVKARQAEYLKFSRFAALSVRQGVALKTPLLITEARYQELLASNQVAPVSEDEQKIIKLARRVGEPQFWLVPSRGDSEIAEKYRNEHFPAYLAQALQIEWFCTAMLVVFSEDDDFENAQFFEVLANPDSIPLTADYDLFTVCPHPARSIGFTGLLQRLIQRQLSEPSGSASPTLRRFKMGVKLVEETLETRKKYHDSDWGTITPFQRIVSTEMNQIARAAGYKGGDLIHHGCETANPVTSIDFPILVITPGLTFYSIENMDELMQVARDMQFYGYIFHRNPLWRSVYDLHETVEQKKFREKGGVVVNWDDRYDPETFRPHYIQKIDACLMD